MKSRLYIIHTKSDKVRVQAKNRDEAFAKFFIDVEDGKVKLEQLGNIIMLKDGKEEYPFRTVPLLYQLKLMSASDAISNIMAVTDVKKKEAEQMLMDYSFKDARLIPIMTQIREKTLLNFK